VSRYAGREHDRIIFSVLIVLVAVALNHPDYLVEKTTLVHRIVVPVLLLIGLIGSVGRIKLLRLLGWAAIAWFLPVILLSVPDLEHMDPALRGFPTFWRLATSLTLSGALVVSYLRLAYRK
jgi:hypothetical protein